MISKYGSQNSVSSENQLAQEEYSSIYEENGRIKVLFVGNSITKHGPAPDIGWNGNWGMAASEMNKDYVHLIVSELKKYHSVDYSIAQCSKWETKYWDTENIMNTYYKSAREFDADIIVIRIGENIKNIENKEICKLNFQKMIEFFNKSKKAKIIVTNLFWNHTVLNKIIEDVSIENGYIFCDISDLEMDERTMAIGEYDHNGVAVHPSDYGMKCIADRIKFCIGQI